VLAVLSQQIFFAVAVVMGTPAKRARLDAVSTAPDGLAVMLIDVEEEPDGTILLWGLADGPGLTPRTVLLRCPDYQPYFFIPCPHVVNPSTQELQDLQQQDLLRLRRAINSRWAGLRVPWTRWSAPHLPLWLANATVVSRHAHTTCHIYAELMLAAAQSIPPCKTLACWCAACCVPVGGVSPRLPQEQALQSLQVLQLSPIMYYRPAQPQGVPYIQAFLKPGEHYAGAAVKVVL
jgi:hypothetical protein